MVIATILGGTGNQLSAYAAAYVVSKYLNQPLILDVSDYYGGYFRPYVLDLLKIPDHLKIYYPHKRAIYSSMLAAPDKLTAVFECFINTSPIEKREDLLSAVQGKENVWITGYGGPRFCNDEERKELRQLFQPMIKSRGMEALMQEISRRESVAVHVRRTDFVDLRWVNEGILDYYKAAIVYMEQKLERCRFYFFSDDIEWVKENLGTKENYRYISCIGGWESDLEELSIMASCKHHILTGNSTFGIWSCILSSQTGITVANRNLAEISETVIMNERMTEEYCGFYQADYTVAEEECPWDLLYTRLEQNQNEEVIEMVDSLAFNAYGLTQEMQQKLTEMKAIASLQNNDIKKALSIFDYLQQLQRDEFDFSFNYANTLESAGHHLESLLYIGNAIRINKNPDLCADFNIANDLEKEIVMTVGRQRRRHYIFTDLEFHPNIKPYYDSLAIMLRNLGNMVTILNFQDLRIPQDSQVSKDNILDAILNSGKMQDSVYKWEIMKYKVLEINTENGKNIFDVKDFLPEIVQGDDVVFISHSVEGSRRAAGGDPMIFVDVLSEWDVWKEENEIYQEEDWNDIYRHVDKIITKRNLPGEWRDKTVRPFEYGRFTEREEICFIKDRVTELNHYMRNEECLCGVLSVLKAAERLE